MRSFFRKIGPGLLLAGAAIGVSHLIQATRAGAEYGLDLIWILLLACISKYPFIEFGSRYACATGENLIEGYRKLGKIPYWIFIFITVGTMFVIQAAVTIVTAGLAEQFFQMGWSTFSWSILILGICVLLLLIGRYSALDLSMKIIISTLAVLTFTCVVIAFFNPTAGEVLNQPAPSFWNISGLGFVIAFMGWMPIPVDSAVWSSIWVGEKSSRSPINHRLDFNLGYGAAVALGLFFLLLGAFVMFGSGVSFSDDSVKFSAQLVNLYRHFLGDWSGILVAGAAFVTLFSTTLTVTDAYPRVFKNVFRFYHRGNFPKSNSVYRISLMAIPVLSLLILFGFGDSFKYLVDFAAGLSFVSAPILGYFNFKLVQSKEIPENFKLSKPYWVFSWVCLIALFLFGAGYLIYTFLLT